MSRIDRSVPHLRAVRGARPASAHLPVRAMPLQVDWLRVMRDLTASGPLRFELSNSAVRWISHGEPWYAGGKANVAWMRGPGLALAGLSDLWAEARLNREQGEDAYEHLDINDRCGKTLARLSLNQDSNWSGFHALLVRQWAKPAKPAASDQCGVRQACLRRLQGACRLADCGALPECWYGIAVPRLPGRPVDVSLISPFLEVFADQCCGLSVLAGNRGLVQQHVSIFHSCRLRAGKLCLSSSTARLEIALDKLVAARLVDCHYREQLIRLYDEQGFCVAVIAMPADAAEQDRKLWQTLVRALVD